MKELFKDTRKLTFLGVMMAITIILMVTPIGFIRINIIDGTTMHIPTIITGIVLGPIAGLIMGLMFGIASLINALSRPDPITILFVNPLISILPRLFIGPMAYYAYSAFKKISSNNKISIAIGAVIGSFTNTVLVMSMLYLIYAQEIIDVFGSGFKSFLLAIVSINAISEIVLSIIIVVPVVLTYNKIKKK